MIDASDWLGRRDVSLARRPFRFGRAVTVFILLAIANLSTMAMAETVAPSTGSTIAPAAAVIISPTTTTPTAPPTTPPTTPSAPVIVEQTLAPFTPLVVTRAPIISSAPVVAKAPATEAPVTSKPTTLTPTTSPTLAPAPALPTKAPSASPSFRPTISNSPSFSPSHSPTLYPTTSLRPTGAPTTSSQPTSPPSTSSPTGSPSKEPTKSPVLAPTSSPSTTETLFVKRRCDQVLEVEEAEKFDSVQVGIYQLLMKSYTADFGNMVGEPQIVTTCEVTKQDLAGRRRSLQETSLQYLLVMEFTMQYESRYGLEIEEYPRKFAAYVNSNLDKIAEDMKARFLPVVGVQDVIVYSTGQPTLSPSKLGGRSPTIVPTASPVSPPTIPPSISPTTQTPSAAPTFAPVITSPPTPEIEDGDRTNFIIGLAAGLGGATLVMILLIWHMRRKSQQKNMENAARSENARVAQDNLPGQEEGIQGALSVDAMEGPNPSSGHPSSHNDQYENHPPEGYGGQSPQGGMGTVGADSMFSHQSNVSVAGSLSSNPDEGVEKVDVGGLQDEFENFQNDELEYLRSGVEESVYGAEGMMSMAMTRALMEEEDVGVSSSWGGAEGPESIEANALCETNDWIRKNDLSALDERNDFFQEMLNRMVLTVRRGKISPLDGTRAIHCCAAMLGLQLEKDLPNNVLLVYGMRKTNDLTMGRTYLDEAFNQFGSIEGAAIAPSNKGFGFVRFVSQKSVQRALERFRTSEIEVQDVSVMIKPLKGDALV